MQAFSAFWLDERVNSVSRPRTPWLSYAEMSRWSLSKLSVQPSR